MAKLPGAGCVDEHLAEFPQAQQAAHEQVRALIRGAAPEATEAMSYATPTVDPKGAAPGALRELRAATWASPQGQRGSPRVRRSSRPSSARRARCSFLWSNPSRRTRFDGW